MSNLFRACKVQNAVEFYLAFFSGVSANCVQGYECSQKAPLLTDYFSLDAFLHGKTSDPIEMASVDVGSSHQATSFSAMFNYIKCFRSNWAYDYRMRVVRAFPVSTASLLSAKRCYFIVIPVYLQEDIRGRYIRRKTKGSSWGLRQTTQLLEK